MNIPAQALAGSSERAGQVSQTQKAIASSAFGRNRAHGDLTIPFKPAEQYIPNGPGLWREVEALA